MDRVGKVNELSSFLTETRRHLDGLLAKLTWQKEELLSETGPILVNCPENVAHRVPKSSLDAHVAKCKLRSQGVDPLAVLPSSQYFYKSLSTVFPVFIDQAKYNSFKGVEDRSSKTEAQSSTAHLTGNIQYPQNNHSEIDMSDVDLGDEDVTNRVEQFGVSLVLAQTESDAANQNPPDEIRSIYRWKLVPSNYRSLELRNVPPQVIKAWLAVNVPQTGLLSSMAGADVQLINFVMSCLNEQSVAHPDGLVTQLNDLLGQKTKPFVLKLWKFLSVSVICYKYGITEADRAHAELLAAKEMEKKSSTVGRTTSKLCLDSGASSLDTCQVQSSQHKSQPPSQMNTQSNTEPSLPMDVVRFDLTPQQRLAVYEYVVQVGKDSRNLMSLQFDESEKADDTTADSERPKSKFEIMADERDYKRRRQSYRAKNVHITKRSTVEVMRDLIETQMAVLEGQYREEHGDVASRDGDSGSREVPDERGDHERYGRVNNRDWDRGKERDKDRDWRDRRRDRYRDSGRERYRDRDMDRDMDRGRDRDRDKDRDMNRDMDRGRDRDKDRDMDRDMDRGKDRGRDNDRDMNRNMDRDKNRDMDRNMDRGRDKDRDKSRDRDMDRDMDRDRVRERHRERHRGQDNEWNRHQDRYKDRHRERQT